MTTPREKERLERSARRLAVDLQRALDKHGSDALFMLMLVDRNGDVGDWCTYISNAERDGMIIALRDLADRLASGKEPH